MNVYEDKETNETVETDDTETVESSPETTENLEDTELDDMASESDDSLADEIVDPGDISSGDTGGYTGSVSSGDLSDVSGSDVGHYSETKAPMVSPAVGYTVTDPIDYTATLEHIDGTLTLIAFLLLFFWCAHHIKNAVRSFTGRNIK